MQSSSAELILVFLADTHGHHEQVNVPPGDILVHAGDCTRHGTLEELDGFDRWLGTLPHRHKLLIAGNHDFCLQTDPAKIQARLTHGLYLQDRAIELEGIRFYGTPWQPTFFDLAFNLPDDSEELFAHFEAIPADTQVLITHCPPAGQGDLTLTGQRVGSSALRQRLEAIQPAVHCFGHIHEGYGTSARAGLSTLFLNASACTARYRPTNPPWVLGYRRAGGFALRQGPPHLPPAQP